MQALSLVGYHSRNVLRIDFKSIHTTFLCNRDVTKITSIARQKKKTMTIFVYNQLTNNVISLVILLHYIAKQPTELYMRFNSKANYQLLPLQMLSS